MEKINISNIKYDELEIIDIIDSKIETMDVEVENDHYYTLSNGVVSHNTVSLMTQSSSGIEPVFLPFYKRRRKINPNDKNVKVHFVDDVGDSWEEYFVFHHKFKIWAEINGYDVANMDMDKIEEIFKISPYYGACANDINWLESVNMQGKIQKFVDHSISKCVVVDTLINTDKGLFYIDELTDFEKIKEDEFKINNEIDNKVINHEGRYVDITSFFNNGIKPVFKLTLENGLFITCTGNERFIKYDKYNDINEWKMLSDLMIGDMIKIKS